MGVLLGGHAKHQHQIPPLMALTDAKIRTAKPQTKDQKLADSGGLYLLLTRKGHKYWRLKYRFQGKEKLLALGVYPEIGLADARERRDEARKLKAKGIDPGAFKQEQKELEAEKNENSFEKIAREWYALQLTKWSPYYAKQVMQRLEKDVFTAVGNTPIHDISSKDILKMAKTIESRDAIELAHRAVQICGQIFNYAIITEKAENNPATAIRGALKTPKTSHYAHLSANELPEFLEAFERYDGGIQTKLAIKLLILTFVRTNELCGARWEEIDFDKKEWVIPAHRMKMRSKHIVPLSTQAIEILNTLKRLNGKWEYVCPSLYSPRKPMSNNTMLYAIYAMGYRNRATVHGFRATASTILNESHLFHRDAIERQLAHQERNRVRGAYDHSEHMPERRKLMQWWADYIEKAGPKNVKSQS